MQEVRKLVKHSGIYGLGVVATKSISFLMIPVYTRFLAPRDYGVLELLDLLVFFASTIASTGIYGAVFRFYAAYEDERDKKEVIAAALFYTAGISLLAAAGLFLAASPIAQALLGNADYAGFVRILALTFLFSNLAEVPLAYWRAREKTAIFVSANVARAMLGALALVVALVLLRRGVRGVVLANCATSAIAGLTLFGVLLAQIPRRLVAAKLEEMLRYGLPLVLSGLASFVLVFSDRFFLRTFGNLAEVGVYALGYKLAMIVPILITGPFNMAWQWQQFEVAKKQDAGDVFARVQKYQFLVALFVGLCVSVLAKDVLRILTPASYWAAARYVPIIALCYVLESARSVIISGILVQRVTHHLVPITALIVATDLGLNFVLIPRYLAMGAAVATLIAYVAYLGMTFYAARRVYAVRYEYGPNALALGSAVLIYFASSLLNLSLIGSIAVKIVLLCVFILVSTALLTAEERNMFLKMGFSLKERLREGLARAA
jgi:O-antigen/teichoic acid export membrane protein